MACSSMEKGRSSSRRKPDQRAGRRQFGFGNWCGSPKAEVFAAKRALLLILFGVAVDRAPGAALFVNLRAPRTRAQGHRRRPALSRAFGSGGRSQAVLLSAALSLASASLESDVFSTRGL